MSSLPTLNSRKLIKILQNIGFVKVRQKGSHAFFSHSDGRTTVVPIHSKDIGKGLFRSILHDLQMSPEEFKKVI